MDKKLFQTKKKDKAIKGRIIRNIRNIFGYEEEYYYKSVRADKVTIILNIKVKATEKHHQLKNILIKLNHT